MSDNNDPNGSGDPGGNPWMKSLLVWGGIFLALLLVVSMFGDALAPTRHRDALFRFPRQGGRRHASAKCRSRPTRSPASCKNGDSFTTIPVPNDTDLTQLLEENGVKYAGSRPGRAEPAAATS